MKYHKELALTFANNIRQLGVMDNLISDRAQVERSNKLKEILRALFIYDWNSERHK